MAVQHSLLIIVLGMLEYSQEMQVGLLKRNSANSVHKQTIEITHEERYSVEKLNVGITSIFASSTIKVTAANKFYIAFSNSTETMEDESSWWSPLFIKQSYTNIEKNVSPFQDLFFKISSSSGSKMEVSIQVNYEVFDFCNFTWFLGGILLFITGRKLSRSVVFHYTSGASIGMLTSWMIILILLYKLVPYRRAMTTLVVTGTGIGFYFTELLLDKGYNLVMQYPFEVMGFCSFFALLSMALMYYFGPPSTEKSFKLIQWTLQACAICMIYQSSYCKSFCLTAIISAIFLQSVNSVLIKILVFITPHRLRFWYSCPEERHLSTEEYEGQGRIETEIVLKDVAEYCSSPDGSSWKKWRTFYCSSSINSKQWHHEERNLTSDDGLSISEKDILREQMKSGVISELLYSLDKRVRDVLAEHKDVD